jgi:hypothetical protein
LPALESLFTESSAAMGMIKSLTGSGKWPIKGNDEKDPLLESDLTIGKNNWEM